MVGRKHLAGPSRRAGARAQPAGTWAWLLALAVAAIGLATLLGDRGLDDAAREPAGTAVDRLDPATPVPGSGPEVPSRGVAMPPAPSANAGWRPVDAASVDPASIPSYKETVESAVLVELSAAMWSWSVGERVTLSVPQIGATYTPLIDRVETGLGTNRSYVGRLFDNDLPYSFIITVGERNAFANLSTPQGAFELVGNTRLAWLMPMANMDQHVDYSQPDFFIPE